MDGIVILDCDEGRRLGCGSFCCRLIVRLAPGEADPTLPGRRDKSCVDKDPVTGLCVHFDPTSSRCRIWHQRPSVCRAYDCNRDPLLAVALRDGCRSIVDLVTAPPVSGGATVPIPKKPR